MKIHFLPAFSDNYIWLIEDHKKKCVVVDPGDATPVIDYVQQSGLSLDAIIITHTHHDHIGGIAALKKQYRTATVYGPRHMNMPEDTEICQHGDHITLLQTLTFSVIHTPGHKDEHLCYYHLSALFSGDTLFSGGCGRLFEGTPEQMFTSLQRLSALPDHCPIYCAHEYTEANLTFSAYLAPNNDVIKARLKYVKQQRLAGLCTLPSTMAIEKKTNPFLLCNNSTFRAQVRMTTGQCPEDPVQAFAYIRQLKDHF